MKRNALCFVLALMLAAVSAVCVFAQENVSAAVPNDYEGVWFCGRAEIRMIRANMGYEAVITWPASYAEHHAWEYSLLYDAASDSLVDEGTGVKSVTIFDESGSEASYTEDYTDGTAHFRFNGSGKLIWEDAKEDAGKDMEFEKANFDTIFPTQEDFAEHYFKMIGGYPKGVSGASLRQAQAAYNAYMFAWEHMIWNEDVPTLRKNMLAAWESLTDEERSAFDSNFLDVVRLIDRCLDDWEVNKGVFTDAGVQADRLEELLKDKAAQVSWSDLVAHTLTMGNSDGDQQ